MNKSSQALSDTLKIIISDIHGRHKLLKGVMTCFKKPIEVYNLGDVVAYSGSHNSCFYDPNECFDLLRRQGVKSVKGGHDIEALAEPDDTVTLLNSDGTVQPQDYNITEENKKHIHSLPLFIRETINGRSFLFIHGYPQKLKTSLVFEVISEKNAHAFLKLANADIVFVGHSHIPQLFVFSADGLEHKIINHECEITLENHSRYIIDVGSLGDSRHPSLYTSLAVFDVKNNIVRFSNQPNCSDRYKMDNLEYREMPPQEWAYKDTMEPGGDSNGSRQAYRAYHTKKYYGYNLYVGLIEEADGFRVERVLWHEDRHLSKRFDIFKTAVKVPAILEAAPLVTQYLRYLEDRVLEIVMHS